jgi:hypothetical protein
MQPHRIFPTGSAAHALLCSLQMHPQSPVATFTPCTPFEASRQALQLCAAAASGSTRNHLTRNHLTRNHLTVAPQHKRRKRTSEAQHQHRVCARAEMHSFSLAPWARDKRWHPSLYRRVANPLTRARAGRREPTHITSRPHTWAGREMRTSMYTHGFTFLRARGGLLCAPRRARIHRTPATAFAAQGPRTSFLTWPARARRGAARPPPP